MDSIYSVVLYNQWEIESIKQYILIFGTIIVALLIIIASFVIYNTLKTRYLKKQIDLFEIALDNKHVDFSSVLSQCDKCIKKFEKAIQKSDFSKFQDIKRTRKELLLLLFCLIKNNIADFDEHSFKKAYVEHYCKCITFHELSDDITFYDDLFNGKDFCPGYPCLSSSGIGKYPNVKCIIAFLDVIVNPDSKNYTVCDIIDSIRKRPVDNVMYMMFYVCEISPIFTDFLKQIHS